jgi:hypothetical protein
MSVPKNWLLGGWYPHGLIVQKQRYRHSDGNKNVDIKFSAHDAFLEWSWSGKLKVERLSKNTSLSIESIAVRNLDISLLAIWKYVLYMYIRMDNTKLYLFGIVQLRFLSMHSIRYSIANPVTIKTYVLDKFEKRIYF